MTPHHNLGHLKFLDGNIWIQLRLSDWLPDRQGWFAETWCLRILTRTCLYLLLMNVGTAWIFNECTITSIIYFRVSSTGIESGDFLDSHQMKFIQSESFRLLWIGSSPLLELEAGRPIVKWSLEFGWCFWYLNLSSINMFSLSIHDVEELASAC